MTHRLVAFVLLLVMLGVASEGPTVVNNNWESTRIIETGERVNGLVFYYCGYGHAAYNTFAGWCYFSDPEDPEEEFLQGALLRINIETGEKTLHFKEKDGYLPFGSRRNPVSSSTARVSSAFAQT
jgi:hypothetical protein